MNAKIIFLAATLVLVSAPIVGATSEAHPDCEEDSNYSTPDGPAAGHDQEWIGYKSTRSVAGAYAGLGSPGDLFVCEGEHWDGQDTVSDRDAGTTDCITSVETSTTPGEEGAWLCTTSDINDGDADPTALASPVGLRVSSGDGAYVGTNIFSVGRAAVYTDGSNVAAVYLRDNTPPNVLAEAVSAAGVTKGFVSEDDCSQQTYEEGAYDPNPETARKHCGRDNTAITVYFLTA